MVSRVYTRAQYGAIRPGGRVHSLENEDEAKKEVFPDKHAKYGAIRDIGIVLNPKMLSILYYWCNLEYNNMIQNS